jgi:putative copper export protein
LTLGASAVRWLMLPRLGQERADEARACEERLAGLALAATIALVIGLALRLFAHTAAAFGLAESLSIEALRVIGIESRWGGGWRVQMLAAVVALMGASLVRAHRHAGWFALMGAAVACALAVPLLGHAAGEPSRVAYHSIHVLGGGVWLGSLGSILIAGELRAALLPRFAPIALTGAALLAASGSAMAFEYVSPLSDLWRTGYGRTLIVKLLLVGAVVGCGYVNWRRWRETSGTRQPRRLEKIEAWFALAVILVTALLTELEHS